MRDPNRIDVYLEILGRAWKAQPDLRLGQLIDNAHHAATHYHDQFSPDLFYIEDGELFKGVAANVALPQRVTSPSEFFDDRA